MTTPEMRLQELGLNIPAISSPVANYVPYTRVGQMLYLSGQTPKTSDGAPRGGKLGADATVAEGYADARQCALQMIAVAKSAVGDLSRVSIVKVFGMVNAVADFKDHPKVINGASDLFVEVFGENGRHARSAVGMGSLPGGVTVEVEAILRVTGTGD